MQLRVSVCVCLCVCERASAFLYMSVCPCLYMCVCACYIYIYIYIYMCVCVCVCVCVYTYTHIYRYQFHAVYIVSMHSRSVAELKAVVCQSYLSGKRPPCVWAEHCKLSDRCSRSPVRALFWSRFTLACPRINALPLTTWTPALVEGVGVQGWGWGVGVGVEREKWE